MTDFWVTEAMNGFGMTVQVTEELCRCQSKFQKIEVYQTVKLGRMLLLDGIIQLTEYDEFAYHEMLTHVPLFAHDSPKRLLVIGGGDGGVLREAAKHSELEVMDICEIDAEVIEIAKRFLPSISCGYDDPRVKIHIADGSEFIKDKPGYYDVIIVDSTDPGGPGTPLFGEEFYRDMKKALRPGGVIATQSESAYLLPEIVKRLYLASTQVFRSVNYASIAVPTYPTGTIGACVAGDRDDVTQIARPIPEKLSKQLRYYNSAIHQAAFANPSFVKQLLNS
ncbi:MAG: polyamine aminopropyltransferase [Victivallales bacterium]|nr:polyamine aminopropyltransferase [Victivallales bacterium]